MATILNNRSSIATDPIRNFRFLVTFKPHGTSVTNAVSVNNGVTSQTTSVSNADASTSWANGLAAIPFGFTSVGGLAVSTDSIPYREGGYNTTVHQIPGQTSFAPITLQRGVILGSDQNWKWMRELFQTVQGTVSRSAADNFRVDLTIDVLTHPLASTATAGSTTGTYTDHVSLRFNIYNAWIQQLAYSDLNAGDNAIMVEQMSLVHEGFDMTWGKDLTDAGSAAKIEEFYSN